MIFDDGTCWNGLPVGGGMIQITTYDEGTSFRDIDLTGDPLELAGTVTRTFDADQWAVFTEHFVISREPGEI